MIQWSHLDRNVKSEKKDSVRIKTKKVGAKL